MRARPEVPETASLIKRIGRLLFIRETVAEVAREVKKNLLLTYKSKRARFVAMSKLLPKVMSFRLQAEDLRELEKFKRSLAPTWGKLTNAQAFRIAIRRLNLLNTQEQK